MKKRPFATLALLLIASLTPVNALSCSFGSSYSVKPIENVQQAIDNAPIVVVAKRHPEGVYVKPENSFAGRAGGKRFLQVKVIKTLKGQVDSDIINIDSTEVPCTTSNIFNFRDDNEHILLLEKIFPDFYSPPEGIFMESGFYFEKLPGKPNAEAVYYDKTTKQHLTLPQFISNYKF